MSLNLAIVFALVLIVALFAVAALVEAQGERLQRTRRLRHVAYTLALGVYCSSWTFYGAVGSAVRDGWVYLAIYLGPVILLLAAPKFLRSLANAVAEEQAVTVSDFIAARFGHDVIIARLVTVIALLGTIPYIALQFRSIGNAFSLVSGRDLAGPAMVAAAVLLTLFSILFAARRFELAGRSEGLLFAIGLESLIKIFALLLVGLVSISLLASMPGDVLSRGQAVLGERFSPSHLSLDFVVTLVISVMAIVVLPRQFYMGLVEAQERDDLVRARFGLAAYLIAMALLILPIALAGTALFEKGQIADLYVLLVPSMAGQQAVLVIAMLGGISAAAAMAIVDSSALATMVSNDLLFPAVLRSDPRLAGGAIGRRMLVVRRLSIAVIMALALAWATLVSSRESLASIGLVAFAAMAQFTPHLIMAVNQSGRDPLPARASLTTGLLLWLYTLGLPPILPEAWLGALASGPLDPLHLFGIGNTSPLVHGVIWSLGANLLVFALMTARGAPGRTLPLLLRSNRKVTDLEELVQLTSSFVGQERADREFPDLRKGAPVDRRSAARAQKLIAGVVGSSSARSLVASALAGGQMSLTDVTRLLDEGGQSLRFSRQLLADTFENIDAGISVVDRELNLVAWNSRYEELFDYPPGLVRVGVPVADLIRHNVKRGDFGPGDVEYHVEKRLDHLRRRLEHSFERRRSDGRVIKTVGGPMSDGGYVMSFTDITGEANAREELRRTLDELEHRVTERTRELSEANRRLAKADHEKTRFLAAASHDLLQPLHAARLFTAALEREPQGNKELVRHVGGAIVAAEDLLRALLDISKLDAGGVNPRPEPVALQGFLTDLAESFRPLAEEKALDLRIGPCPGVISADPRLLRSVVQNLLSNALRYTPAGGILIGTRRRGDEWRIDVIDTGVGIAPEQLGAIFGEFTRLGEVEVEGLGLGLALVERISRLLGGRVDVSSVPGKGSRFSLILPALDGAGDLPIPPVPASRGANERRLAVLVIDNDERIVAATSALLERLGHRPLPARSITEALARCDEADLMLVDYQLDDGEDGLTLVEEVRARRPAMPALLLTAESGEAMLARAAELGVPVLTKPVDPESLVRAMAEISVPEVQP
ncbi:PAS domain-containing hybrid sensor histidine kinase/response regulator [Novosphingobium sp. MW5]|nr:PAS domain-containing hybrid sensor histidine kinase/response regulator [Novosphingobium sp. MW5]